MIKKNLLILLQARCSSKRFPNKVLKKINGIPLVILCAKRLSNKGRKVIVLTSNNNTDNKLVKLLIKNRIAYQRGSLNNVLSRYQSIAKDLKKNHILIRATSDNAVPDGQLVEILLNHFKKSKKDYLKIDPKIHFLPKGVILEIFTAKKILSLRKKLTKNDLEHVTYKIYKKKKNYYKFIFKKLILKKNLSNISLSIDTKKEYLFVKKIFKNFKYPTKVLFSTIIKKISHGN